jgi:protein-S-isoprenylcysteine O-methyltransferase Ste14
MIPRGWDAGSGMLRWLTRTPVQTFVLCPLTPRAGGGRGMERPPDRIIATGPYRYTRNPMYLGHLIFMMGLAVTFWSWFALVLLAARAIWFHQRVLHDERRLEARFGAD